MASLSELISLARFKEEQKALNRDDTGAKMQEITQMVGEMIRKRKETETKKRLWDVIQKQEAEGKIVPEYDISAEGDISIKYKQPPKEQGFVSAVNKAAERIKGGEDFDTVTGELAVEGGSKYTDRIEDYLRKFEPEKEEETPLETPKKLSGWEDVNLFGRIGAAATPSATPSEKQLGPLRPGGVFKPPAKATGKKDQYGFVLNEVKEIKGKKYKYIGNNKWQELS